MDPVTDRNIPDAWKAVLLQSPPLNYSPVLPIVDDNFTGDDPLALWEAAADTDLSVVNNRITFEKLPPSGGACRCYTIRNFEVGKHYVAKFANWAGVSGNVAISIDASLGNALTSRNMNSASPPIALSFTATQPQLYVLLTGGSTAGDISSLDMVFVQQNRLENPTFDTDTSGWTDNFGVGDGSVVTGGVNTLTRGTNENLQYQSFPTDKGIVYCLKARVRQGTQFPQLTLYEGLSIVTDFFSTGAITSPDFTEVLYKFVAPTTEVTVSLDVTGGLGTADFDYVTITAEDVPAGTKAAEEYQYNDWWSDLLRRLGYPGTLPKQEINYWEDILNS